MLLYVKHSINILSKAIKYFCCLYIFLLFCVQSSLGQCPGGTCTQSITTSGSTIPASTMYCVSSNSNSNANLITVSSTATLCISGNSNTLSNITIASGGIVCISGTGNTLTINTLNTSSGTYSIIVNSGATGNVINAITFNQGTLTITNNLAAASSGVLTINATSNISLTGLGNGGAATFNHNGTGMTTLNGGIVNSNTQNTNININGGTLNVGASSNVSIDFLTANVNNALVSVALGASLITTGSIAFGANATTSAGVTNLGYAQIGSNASGYSITTTSSSNVPLTNGSSSNTTATLITSGGISSTNTSGTFTNYGIATIGQDGTNGYSFNLTPSYTIINGSGSNSTATLTLQGGIHLSSANGFTLTNYGGMTIGQFTVFGATRGLSLDNKAAITNNSTGSMTVLGNIYTSGQGSTFTNSGKLNARNIFYDNTSAIFTSNGGECITQINPSQITPTSTGSLTTIPINSNTDVCVGDYLNSTVYVSSIASATSLTVSGAYSATSGTAITLGYLFKPTRSITWSGNTTTTTIGLAGLGASALTISGTNNSSCTVYKDRSNLGSSPLTGGTYNTGTITACTPSITISTPIAVSAGNMGINTTNNIISTFTVTTANVNTNLNAVTFTTTGTAVQTTDITNFKLYANTTGTSFAGATFVTGATITTGLSAGSHTFTGLSQICATSNPVTFFITADIPSGGTNNSTIIASSIANTNILFSAGNKTGIVTAGGTQTILTSTPTISTTGTLSALTTCSGTASSTTSFSVSGTNLTAGISLAALSGFEYCLTIGGTYTSTLTVGAAGTVSATTVYVRLASADVAGSYSGNIVLSSSGASSVNVATTGSTVNVLPSISNLSTSAVSTICAGSSASVTINSTTLTTGNYTVTYTVSGTNTVSTSTASMSFTSGSPGTGLFTTSVLNSAGASNVVNITAIAFTATNCSSTVSTSTAAFTTTALPTPTFSAQPGASTCIGTSVTYSTQSGGGQSAYSWSIPGTANTDYSITSGGTTTSSVTLQWLTAGSKTVTINYSLNGCTAALSTSSTATTVNALPTISGTLQVCVGSTTQLTGSGTAAGSTPWVSGTTSIATTTSVGLVSGVAAGTSIITYTNNNGCSKTASVTVNARPSTAVLAGTATICNGNSTNLTVTITGGTTPFTVIYSGGTVSSYTSASNISVSPSSTTPYSLTSVTDVNGCIATTPSGTPTITVNAVPTPTLSAQPGSTTCSNTNVTYTTQASYSSYSWTYPGSLGTDYSITSGGGNTNSVILRWLTTGSKTVTINYSNGTCSAVSPTSSTATAVTSSTLSTPGTITGTATVVQGQTGVSYSISSITNATGYTWTLPSNASITAGSNTNSITVSYASNALSGTVYVSATNSCVTSSSSPTYAVTVAPLLTAAVSASVDAAFDVTFTDNSSWRTAISSITINGSTLASGAYNTTVAGKITFTPSLSTLLQSTGTKSIVVIATGYSNSTVSQTINPGAVSKLAVQATPVAQSSYSAALFTTQPVILIQDQYGNTTSSNANITATVGAGTWTLAGTSTIAAVNGTATFTTLTSYCTSAVTGATIVFNSTGVSSITCTPFNIPLISPREMYYINAGGNWSVAANWRVGGCSGTTTTSLPTSSDNVFLNCGSSTVTLDVAGVCNNIIIANGVTLNVGSNNLTISGDLSCNNNNNGGTFTWGTGTVTVSGNVTFGSSWGGVTPGTGFLVMNGNTKVLNINNNITLPNFRLGSSTISVSTSSSTLTISGSFDMNNQTALIHTSGTVIVSGTISNSGSMAMRYTGTPSFTYTGGGTIAPGNYYNLTTSSTAANIACGSTVNVDNVFTNSTTLTGSSTVGTWAAITNANPLVNTGTIGSSSTYLSISSTISGGTISGTNGINVLQNNSLSASCTAKAIILLGSTTISGLGYCYSSATSTSTSVSIAGVDLSTDITVTAPTNFEVSKDNSTFASSVTYTVSGSIVSPTVLYVRLKTGLAIGNYNSSNITCSSASAITQNIIVSASVNVLPSVSASASTPVYTVGSLTLLGRPNYMTKYAWSGPNSFTSSIQNPSITNPSTSAAGVYILTATNSYGCTATASTSSVVVNTVTNYYSKSTGNLDVLSNWGQSTDGTGTAPLSFTADGQIFNIRNNASPTLGAAWTVSGSGSKVIVGDGTNACTFTVPSNYNFAGTIDVSNNGSLTIANSITNLITLGVLNNTGSNGSSVSYTAASSQNVLAGNYYNLSINGNSVLPSGIVNISNILSTSGTPTVTGSTIVFSGSGNQTIPSMTYNNLQTQVGGTKTLGGNTTLNGILTIGTITVLNASSYSITMAGTTGHNRIVLSGTFVPATSTVFYTTANDTVSAVNYYNLNLTGGSGKLSNSGIISIGNIFTPGIGSWTTTGSTLLFNGITQTIPAWTYGNLKINTGTSASPSTVTLGGAVSISGTLTLNIGYLVSSATNTLTLTNTASTAISGGYSYSFVNGPLTWNFPNSSSSTFTFPVGKGTTYLPFSIKTITGTSPVVTLEAFTTGTGGSYIAPITALSTTEYWSVTETGLTSGQVSLSRQSSLGSLNSIAHCPTASGLTGTYTNVNGTINGTSIQNSDVTSFSYFTMSQRTLTAATYYYDGSGSLTDITNWGTNTDGSGTHPSNFSSNDATYIVTNTAAVTLSSNWTISGSNSLLVIGDGTSATNLSVTSGTSLITSGSMSLKCNSTFTTASNATVTVNGDFGIADFGASTCGSTKPITINNSGTLSVNGDLLQPINSYSTINNTTTGTINITNGNYSDGDATTKFNNAGNLNLTTGFFTLTQQAVFTNLNGGNVKIDNTAAPLDSVLFQYLNFPTSFISDAGSTFSVIGVNLYISGSGAMPIDGSIAVDGGNLNINAGGATLNIASTGTVAVFDPSNSGKGLLNMSYGGITLNDAGNLYANGITYPSGGGSSISVQSGGNAFIGNIGLVTNGNSNQIAVLSGGTLNYCGNKTAIGDNLGTVASGGVLNYALGYYESQTPGAQGDFTVNGTQSSAFPDGNSCSAAFTTAVDAAVTSTALPISLSTFDIKQSGDLVAIEWTTETETNNDFFSVMKSYDAITFDVIGDVPGVGTSTVKHSYNLNDENPQIGINYYKLKQTDFDGHFTYSTIKSLNFTSKNVDFLVYPNPSKFENITIIVNVKRTEDLQLMITDIIGRQVFTTNMSVDKGQKKILLIDYTILNPGTYYFSIIGNEFIETKKVIVQ